MSAHCLHSRLIPAVCDQTLGVTCLDCGRLVAYCWAEQHVPESLWNLACTNNPECTPCEQSRDYYCAICESPTTDLGAAT